MPPSQSHCLPDLYCLRGLGTHLGVQADRIADDEKDHLHWGAFRSCVPGSRYYYYPHLIDYETETQKCYVAQDAQ